MYVVTRQLRTDGGAMVEISRGGLDYCNPDALQEKYAGEFGEYPDPRDATRQAIKIMKSWQADEPDQKIKIGYGDTLGMTMPFDSCTVAELERWGRKEYARLPRCDWCGDTILEDVVTLPDCEDVFCSEFCAREYNGVD